MTSNVIDNSAPLARFSGSIEEVMSQIGCLDFVHDSGIWLPHNHALSRATMRFKIPRFVSPRGMLEPWAMRYKRIKKSIAWQLYQKQDLNRAIALHATSESEADHIRALGVASHTFVVANGMDLPDEAEVKLANATRSTANDRRTALFLSRVHPKKGLPLLIDAWTRLRPQSWRLVIAGPSEVGHSKEIAITVGQRGLTEFIQIIGPQYGEEKASLLRSSDLFILPTYSENFGMAVAEALAYGIPVLTTTGTPWSDVVDHRAGWWVAPNADAITAALSNAVAKPTAELQAMGARGRELIRKSYGWDGIAERTIEAYVAVLRSKTKLRAG